VKLHPVSLEVLVKPIISIFSSIGGKGTTT
jgi:hypothetical protein